jgi:hypothetical protein
MHAIETSWLDGITLAKRLLIGMHTGFVFANITIIILTDPASATTLAINSTTGSHDTLAPTSRARYEHPMMPGSPFLGITQHKGAAVLILIAAEVCCGFSVEDLTFAFTNLSTPVGYDFPVTVPGLTAQQPVLTRCARQ